jgi:hypothetical protein
MSETVVGGGCANKLLHCFITDDEAAFPDVAAGRTCLPVTTTLLLEFNKTRRTYNMFLMSRVGRHELNRSSRRD